jgi:hypothetical protein
MPAGSLYGTWTIGGSAYEAVNGVTRFEQEHGPIAVGQCVKVKYTLQGSQRLASRIESHDECEGAGELAEAKGPIESFPPSLVGQWRIGGAVYTATAATRFSQSESPFAVGACVEVKYQTATRTAVSIATEDSRECGGGLNVAKAKGTLISFPPGLLGTWTVNSTTYEVVAATVLDRDHGDFYAGACVEVRYLAADPARTAVKVETESADDCGDSGVITPTLEARGIISARPPTDTLFGTWEIGGESYDAISGTTQFKQERGGLQINQCAKVRYFMQGSQRIATRISSEERHECGNAGEERKFYGAISQLPNTQNLFGVWVIGGRSVNVSAATELKNGPFTIGLIVEVRFTRQNDGSLLATKIEGKQSASGENRRLGKAFGILQLRPPAPAVVGTWEIASVTYAVSTTTKLEGSLNVGDCVQVHYRTDAIGARQARKIDTKSPVRCAALTGEVVSKTYGFVEQMPAGGFVGSWVIGGVTFDANTSTRFEQERGALATGAFVEVSYTVRNGVNVALKIEMHVPPNAGAINAIGTLDLSAAAQGGDAAQAETWMIGGQTYTIVDATLLNDAGGAFADGRKVYVNAYVDPTTGAKVATQITALGDKSVYLPVTLR